MVSVRFRGVELEESAKSEEARRRINTTAEAEGELLHAVAEAYSSNHPDGPSIGRFSLSLHFAGLLCPLRLSWTPWFEDKALNMLNCLMFLQKIGNVLQVLVLV